MVQAAAIYARISDDRDGSGLGVERQLQDCRRLAAERGWPVAEEYVDNDRSAFRGASRERYAQMVEDIAAGHRDGVIVYHQDRLTRTPLEFEQFIETCRVAGVADLTTVSGPLNVSNGDGVLMARIMSVIAAQESEDKSRRIRRKNDERAAAGLPHRSGERAFGYERDGVTIREDEAVVIREIVARFLAGESIQSLTRWLHAEDVTTSTGAEWRAQTVRNILASPRNAGLLVHRREVVGPGVWTGIITVEQHERVKRILSDPARTTNRGARRYVLSGLVHCSRCEHVMYSAVSRGRRRYGCKSGPNSGGCGGTFIVADALEEVIVEALLTRLDTPALAKALRGSDNSDEVAILNTKLIDAQRRLDELAAERGRGEISAREWQIARKAAESQRDGAQSRIGRLQRNDSLIAWAGHGKELRTQWADLPLTRQAAITKALVDRVRILPGKPSKTMDLGRIDVIWRA
jgi:site-specific DNA recombinase